MHDSSQFGLESYEYIDCLISPDTFLVDRASSLLPTPSLCLSSVRAITEDIEELPTRQWSKAWYYYITKPAFNCHEHRTQLYDGICHSYLLTLYPGMWID